MSKLSVLAIGLFFMFFISCETKRKTPFIQFQNITKPVILGKGTLSKDSIQWNNVYVSGTNEIYYTQMEGYISKIKAMTFDGNTFKDGQTINFSERSSYSDMYVDADGKQMLFASNMQEYESDTINNWNLWRSERKNDTWETPALVFEESLQGNQFYPWLTKSGNLYFSTTRDGSGNSDLFYSKLKAGKYQTPVSLPKQINSIHLEGDAYVHPTEEYLIFAGFEREMNLGKSDLYISFNKGENSWSNPVWLGEDINSKGYDGSPFVTQDGEFLIFTSSRGSTDENTYFNHYIIGFNANKYKIQNKD